ncbi:MAG: PDZ domain-containing protein [Alphaproteobacteria bacterium]|nr:PDZ domain-containing protein [Alphaproteobacteria bacterium]
MRGFISVLSGFAKGYLSFFTSFALIFSFFALISVIPAHSQSFDSSFIPDLVERIEESLVTISVYPSAPLSSGGSQNFFDQFIKESVNPGASFGAITNLKRLSQEKMRAPFFASGFFIDASGLLLTGSRIPPLVNQIFVEFGDGERYQAEVVGHDTETNLTVLRVRLNDEIEPVEFVDSKKLRIGEWIMTASRFAAFTPSVDVGIVSGRYRNAPDRSYGDFIQTNIPVEMVNSGAPLFNKDGKLVGVNVSTYSIAGDFSGKAFALASNSVKKIISQLVEFGEVRRGWIGVHIRPVSPVISEFLGMDNPHGLLITSVEVNSPADMAGLKRGDVIILFQGKKLFSASAFKMMIADANLEEDVNFTILRRDDQQNLKMMNLKVAIVFFEESEGKTNSYSQRDRLTNPRSGTTRILGAEMSELTMQLRRQLNISREIDGVVVLLIDSDSPLVEKGIMAGSVITEVGLEEVWSPGDIEDRLNALKKKGDMSALLRLSNGAGRSRFVSISIEKDLSCGVRKDKKDKNGIENCP